MTRLSFFEALCERLQDMLGLNTIWRLWLPSGVKDSMSSDTRRNDEIKTRGGKQIRQPKGEKSERKLKGKDKSRRNIHECRLISIHALLLVMMGP